MDYNRVGLFVKVVKNGSFTATAREVGLPKSSVSRSVARLEEELRARLLQRTTRKLVLTEVGEAFYESAVGAMGALDEAERCAQEKGREVRGTVRLTAPPDLELAKAFAEFGRRYPLIRIEVVSTSRRVDLVAEGFDMALRAGRLEDSSLVARRIGETELVLVAAPSYLKKKSRPKRPGDLAKHAFVLHPSLAQRRSLALLGPDGEEASTEVLATVTGDDLRFCRELAEAAAGIAILPTAIVVGALEAGRLQLVLPGWKLAATSPLFLLLPTVKHMPKRVAVLRDFLIRWLQDEISDRRARARGKPRSRAAGRS
jgi:DNA-binding transcriptional LysR family regulator